MFQPAFQFDLTISYSWFAHLWFVIMITSQASISFFLAWYHSATFTVMQYLPACAQVFPVSQKWKNWILTSRIWGALPSLHNRSDVKLNCHIRQLSIRIVSNRICFRHHIFSLVSSRLIFSMSTEFKF